MDVAGAAGIALGALADLALGDPRRGHPVAGFGRAAGALEQRVWRDSRTAGTAYWLACVVPVAALGALLPRRTAVTAAATWAVLGGTSLGRAGATMDALLDDLPAARAHLPTLAGRDPAGLGEAELVRATVESVAENTSDAAVAPLLWGAVAGVPGLLAYRAVNTLDAMVGYRSARYRRFGWAAARADDVANWLPARLTAALTVVVAPLVGGSAAGARRIWRRDGAAHPSPNSGRCEAAAAGALGVVLGGRNVYGSRVEERPTMGDGAPPVRADVARAVALSRAVWTASAVLAVAVRLLRPARQCDTDRTPPSHPPHDRRGYVTRRNRRGTVRGWSRMDHGRRGGR